MFPTRVFIKLWFMFPLFGNVNQKMMNNCIGNMNLTCHEPAQRTTRNRHVDTACAQQTLHHPSLLTGVMPCMTTQAHILGGVPPHIGMHPPTSGLHPHRCTPTQPLYSHLQSYPDIDGRSQGMFQDSKYINANRLANITHPALICAVKAALG